MFIREFPLHTRIETFFMVELRVTELEGKEWVRYILGLLHEEETKIRRLHKIQPT